MLNGNGTENGKKKNSATQWLLKISKKKKTAPPHGTQFVITLGNHTLCVQLTDWAAKFIYNT